MRVLKMFISQDRKQRGGGNRAQKAPPSVAHSKRRYSFMYRETSGIFPVGAWGNNRPLGICERLDRRCRVGCQQGSKRRHAPKPSFGVEDEYVIDAIEFVAREP